MRNINSALCRCNSKTIKTKKNTGGNVTFGKYKRFNTKNNLPKY